MRRLCLTLLVIFLAAPAALASPGAANDGVFEVRAANVASATVVGQRGTLWGQMDKGRLVVTDVLPGDGQIFVSGAKPKPGSADNVTVYTGRDIHFRVTGGKYKLYFVGSGIDLTAVGIGVATLTGDIEALETGDYALDGGKWTPVPYLKRVIPFGVQPAGP